jgi:hypothetical protein
LKEKHGYSVVAATGEAPFSSSGRLIELVSLRNEFRKFAAEHQNVLMMPFDFPIVDLFENARNNPEIAELLTRGRRNQFSQEQKTKINAYLAKLRELDKVNKFDFAIPESIDDLKDLLEFRSVVAKHIYSSGYILDFDKFKEEAEKDRKYQPLLSRVVSMEKRRAELEEAKKPAKITTTEEERPAEPEPEAVDAHSDASSVVEEENDLPNQVEVDNDVERLIRNSSPTPDLHPDEISPEKRKFADVSVEEVEKNINDTYQNLSQIIPEFIANTEDDFNESLEFIS